VGQDGTGGEAAERGRETGGDESGPTAATAHAVILARVPGGRGGEPRGHEGTP
jgi:hypothetical protein